MAFVSPSKLSYTDTHNTLKYAVRAMKIELQAQKKVHNVNAHTPMYSSLVEEYKRKVEGLQRKLDKAENEKSKLEIQVVELKKSLATAKDALLQDQHTDAGSIVPASHRCPVDDVRPLTDHRGERAQRRQQDGLLSRHYQKDLCSTSGHH
ncbi:hypothetical protein HPB51_029202 [Rhipicephalus microplus]|uniref:Kinesin motor domain-containing protein n=1 Tax=Rhipicephalus microplus TaxID=6941 RepID=A0A9J6CV77_RHIMP|nr:hypothetical protein HPB51_029202 [Rhipicephalus microplus]